MVRSRIISRPVYQSAVQVHAQPVITRVVPKLSTINVKIYNSAKHVNKQVQKKKQTDWFEKNTGMDKQDQKFFFDVLKVIDKDGKNRGLSQQQRTLEQLYYIAGINYSGSKPQMLTSRVQKYGKENLNRIIGTEKTKLFEKMINKQSKMHKVDLSHMAITAAGALDKKLLLKEYKT